MVKANQGDCNGYSVIPAFFSISSSSRFSTYTFPAIHAWYQSPGTDPIMSPFDAEGVEDPPRRWRPWRSAVLGSVVAAAVLAAATPLFLCMPPWNDVTLHDMAVRSMLRGGVHYRDVFDTNLPGIDWLMAGVRLAAGWRYEVLRAVDLAVMAMAVWLLLAWVARAGANAPAIAWLAAAAALYYPFTSEFNHVQRDPWMLLPALVAMRMRYGRVEASGVRSSPINSVFEGVVWGVAVWIKPHVIVPAAAVWFVSAILIARREIWLGVLQDLFWLIVGGLIAGGAGIGWMLATGAWPHFLEIFLRWNPGYLEDMWPATLERLDYTAWCFAPWSLVHFVAVPLALLAFWEARLWSRRSGDPKRIWTSPRLYWPAETEHVANARAFLAALYLGWYVQAVCLQKGFEYVQVPLVLLALTVVATHRWAVGFVYLVWFALLGAILGVPALATHVQKIDPGTPVVRLERHPLTDPQIVALIPRCYREGSTPEIRDRTGHHIDVHCGTNWRELNDVAEYLRGLDPPLGPGELNCWHDSTHPLYLLLDVDPATRYMHYGTVLAIRSSDDWIKKRVAKEVAESRQKYVVSDLKRATKDHARAYAPGAGGDPLKLPEWLAATEGEKFPWNQPIVYRSGRYLVHRVEKPLGAIDIPDWNSLEEPAARR
jgi:hypothetical protein